MVRRSRPTPDLRRVAASSALRASVRCGLGGRVVRSADPRGPKVPFPRTPSGATIWSVQVIASERPVAGLPSRFDVARALAVGTVLIAGATILAYLVFATEFLALFAPAGRTSPTQILAGALAWTFALTAPAGFGLLGLVRVGSAVERLSARRGRPSPVVRIADTVGDDHAVATNVRLPDGSRVIPELVIGPFGAAVIEELPPTSAVVSRGPRSWEVRLASGRSQLIDHPLERATRDAERVRLWFDDDDSDHVVKVYSAVVGTDPAVTRSPSCAYIGPDQVGPWLASLPPQRSFDSVRRDRIIRLVRAGL